MVPINFFLYQMEAVKDGVGSRQERGEERKIELIKGEREGIGENRKWCRLRKVIVAKDT
jgi:hypothetical protein